jgi:hypothetical protein
LLTLDLTSAYNSNLFCPLTSPPTLQYHRGSFGRAAISSIGSCRVLGHESSEATVKPRRCEPCPTWSDPKSSDWDLLRVLFSDAFIAPNPLLALPPRNHTYIDGDGQLNDHEKYCQKKKVKERPYPKLAIHTKNGTATPALRFYYEDIKISPCHSLGLFVRCQIQETL